jgi:hypothetical protein
MNVRMIRFASLAIALSLAVVSTLSAQTAQMKTAAAAPAKQAAAKAEKWTGTISDAMCGKSHGANGGTEQKDHDCAVKCAKGGEQYVFVAGDKVFKIANQKFAGLDTHAGHKVTLEGTLKGDTITVTKVTMPGK